MGESQKAARKPAPLVLIGGAEDRTGEALVLRGFVRFAGGPNARLVVVTVASEYPAEVGAEYASAFRRLGCKETARLDIPDRANPGHGGEPGRGDRGVFHQR